MIDFHNVSKSYRLRNGQVRQIMRGLTLSLPRERNVALVGRNGAGKSTTLKLISGNLMPDRGTIIRHGRVSWPMGFSGGMHPALTGRQNARFIARIYGADTDEMADFVADFSELGAFLDMPVQTYSSGMRARLAFGISLAAEFDTYLIDEITEVGDAAFRKKCRDAFRARMQTAQVIVAAHSEATLRSMCDSVLLLDNGVVRWFDDLEEGLREYRKLIGV
ncbi:ABC transporter ATP-binding protein [Paenirhodobacter populi]|uniref:ABC transporter ATP-binding protein n=1 Tax=Paenirhodobacter populi TaxID=2306993 RepID=A0A443IVP0_9RHOB|nr:ABC transporter ATP-binding protein [Sinirhodobacter populi]RWR10218.1 ABC transporter ATP-binding protein [Sinirhodobacter populi]RWR12104.1 ABC transporter ATP-binding protein [Sinirhodobacter populi]